jgi:hypothetical protein
MPEYPAISIICEGNVDQKSRHKRLRLLLKRLNKERKTQAQKIDILCNDLVGAHRQFINKLNSVSFKAAFYESIISVNNINDLLYRTSKSIEQLLPRTNTAFFLRQQEGFKMYLFESKKPISLNKKSLENYFSDEIVENICKTNRICSIEDMLTMGFETNPTILNRLSAFTIPLGRFGPSQGFILIYRPAEIKLTATDLDKVCAITTGLSTAIKSCKMPVV